MSLSDDTRLAGTFVALADTLHDDFDVAQVAALLAGECTEVVDAAAASVLLTDRSGDPYAAATSSDLVEPIARLEIQAGEGPGLESLRSGEEVVERDLGSDRWPAFGTAAASAGLHAVHALPMRLRDAHIGAVSLFSTRTTELRGHELHLARALVDISAIGILQERLRREAETLAAQLQGALGSRVVIEQAKGIVAARGSVDMETAFEALRRYARHHRTRLSDIARGVISGDIGAESVLAF